MIFMTRPAALLLAEGKEDGHGVYAEDGRLLAWLRDLQLAEMVRDYLNHPNTPPEMDA